MAVSDVYCIVVMNLYEVNNSNKTFFFLKNDGKAGTQSTSQAGLSSRE